MSGTALAYVALGSNLGDSRAHLQYAMASLHALPTTALIARSRIYRTPPWGITNQPDFLNAAVCLRTSLNPHALLQALQVIESAAGRTRGAQRWGPRTLDLDLLHVEGVVLDDPQLRLPHPRIAERAFVLLPLNDLAPTLDLPGLGHVEALLAQVDTTGCEALA